MANDEISRHEPARERFLLAMYSEMWANINRHLLVVWQPLAVVTGGVVLFGFVQTEILDFDFAVTSFLLLVLWMIAHIVDASFWYNRNLHIIRNIERQFLNSNDLRDVHCFFGSDPKTSPTEHFKLQALLGGSLGFLVLAYHFITQVWPGLFLSWSDFRLLRAAPYVTAVVGISALASFYRAMRDKLCDFTRRSPGAELQD